MKEHNSHRGFRCDRIQKVKQSLLWPEAAAHPAHPPHAPPSPEAETPLGVVVEPEALHDEVSEGRHARNPTHTCTAKINNN